MKPIGVGPYQMYNTPPLAPPIQVITHLQSQRARQELLSMLYEVELHRHHETHRLLSATNSQLEQWRGEGEGRIVSSEPHLSVD